MRMVDGRLICTGREDEEQGVCRWAGTGRPTDESASLLTCPLPGQAGAIDRPRLPWAGWPPGRRQLAHGASWGPGPELGWTGTCPWAHTFPLRTSRSGAGHQGTGPTDYPWKNRASECESQNSTLHLWPILEFAHRVGNRKWGLLGLFLITFTTRREYPGRPSWGHYLLHDVVKIFNPCWLLEPAQLTTHSPASLRVSKLFFVGLLWVFIAAQAFSSCGVLASHHGGFSFCGVQALGRAGSVVVALGLSFPVACELSQTRDQTCVPCICRQILNYWTAREVLLFYWPKGQPREVERFAVTQFVGPGRTRPGQDIITAGLNLSSEDKRSNSAACQGTRGLSAWDWIWCNHQQFQMLGSCRQKMVQSSS